jgi:hypothetical protein
VPRVEGERALSSSLDQTPVIVFKDFATVTLTHVDQVAHVPSGSRVARVAYKVRGCLCCCPHPSKGMYAVADAGDGDTRKPKP